MRFIKILSLFNPSIVFFKFVNLKITFLNVTYGVILNIYSFWAGQLKKNVIVCIHISLVLLSDVCLYFNTRVIKSSIFILTIAY